MAQTASNYLEDAKEFKEVANLIKVAFTRAKAILLRNSTMSWNHTANPLPSYIQEDVDGNIKGLDFTRAELSNAVGSFDALKTLFEGGTPATGNHYGNIEKLADA